MTALLNEVVRDRAWRAVASFAGLLGIALPVVGYSVRWLSLGLTGGTPELALAVDLPDASLAGLGPVLWATLIVTSVVRWDLFDLRKPFVARPRPSARGWQLIWLWVRTVSRLVFLLSLLLSLVVGMLLLMPVAMLVLTPVVVYVGWKLRDLIRGSEPMTLSRLSGPVLAALLFSVVSGSLSPAAVLYVGDFTFEGTTLVEGQYRAVADAGGILYLQACDRSPAPVVGVPVDKVESIVLAPGRVLGQRASLLDVLNGTRPVDLAC